MIKKICIILILFPLTFTSCFEPPPPFEVILPVPYYSQWMQNYCAAACIKMWAEFDNAGIFTQDQIASMINIGPYGASPNDVVLGVSIFTYSPGHLQGIYEFEPGAQGDLIAACIEGIKEDVPAIMPFDGGIHAVLVTGFKWREEVDERPIAEHIYFNDPDPSVGEETGLAANILKSYYFIPVDGLYYVILGDEYFYWQGIGGHDQFVFQNGTYYGGPMIYDPKGLLNIEPTPID